MPERLARTPGVAASGPHVAPRVEGVSLVIPAYNEEHAIGPVLAQVADVLRRTGVPHEVVVVDDGSRDGTAAAASGAGATVVRHAHNRGYGAALKTGIRHARYGWIAIMDADGTYPPAALATLLDAAASGEHDMVVAARTGARVHIPLVRRPAKWVLARIASYLCARPIPDLNSGLRLMRREALARHLQLLPSGFSFTSTLTVAMLSGGEPVHFVPIDYHPRVGRSKIRPLRDTLGFLQLVLRTGLYFAPLRFFLPVSAALVALAIAITVASHVLLGRIMDATAAIVFMTAVQVVAIGLLADLIVKRR